MTRVVRAIDATIIVIGAVGIGGALGSIVADGWSALRATLLGCALVALIGALVDHTRFTRYEDREFTRTLYQGGEIDHQEAGT